MKERITPAEVAAAVGAIVMVLVFVASIVMVFVGIWGDWRWIPTGVVTAALSASALVVIVDLNS